MANFVNQVYQGTKKNLAMWHAISSYLHEYTSKEKFSEFPSYMPTAKLQLFNSTISHETHLPMELKQINVPFTRFSFHQLFSLHLSSASKGWNYSGTLPDSLMMSQQTRSFGSRTYCESQDGARPSPNWRRAHHHLDSTDLPGHGKTSDQRSKAGGGQTVLATNRNGGMLRLNATCYSDDDDIILVQRMLKHTEDDLSVW